MTTQSEAVLEENLIAQLVGMGYERVVMSDEPEMLRNLRAQLEQHNETQFSDAEFDRILNYLNKGGGVRSRTNVARKNVPCSG